MKLVKLIYIATKVFPVAEQYGLTAQIRRSALSIPSNIAEGRMRGTRAEFQKFLSIAYASGAELETQLEIAKDVLEQSIDFSEIDGILEEVMRIINSLLYKGQD